MTTTTHRDIIEFDVESTHANRTFRIGIKRPQLPLGTQPPLKDCPILFVLDSYGTLGTAINTVTCRTWLAGDLEPAVVVGIGYPAEILETQRLRTRDLTPSEDTSLPDFLYALIGREHGGADAFLAFILDELAPEILARAPEASPTRRILFGHSLGGLFAAHVLMTHPDAFETYGVSSAAYSWNDFEVTKRLPDFGARLAAAHAKPRVLVCVAALEQTGPKTVPAGMDLQVMKDLLDKTRPVDAAIEFGEALRSFDLAELQFVNFADEDHVSVLPAAISRTVTLALKKRNGA